MFQLNREEKSVIECEWLVWSSSRRICGRGGRGCNSTSIEIKLDVCVFFLFRGVVMRTTFDSTSRRGLVTV